MIDNRTQVFDVAMKNARTIEACLDRLAMMGADHQLKLIAGRPSRAASSGQSVQPQHAVAKSRSKESPGRAGASGSL
jgi:hypothetical protein